MRHLHHQLATKCAPALPIGIMVVLTCLAFATHAQNLPTTTTGRSFWFTFLHNTPNYLYSQLSVIASCDDSCTITLSNPTRHWTTQATIPLGGGLVEIEIPDSIKQPWPANSLSGMGFHVSSTRDISLYASNFIYASYDIATIYPTSALGTHYIQQDYPSAGAEIGIVATLDSTHITVRASSTTSGALPSSTDSLTITLMRGETYVITSNNAEGMSGIEVIGNHPFAMFSGNSCTFVPSSCGACDHLFEQAIPTNYWGRRFIVIPTVQRHASDQLRITSRTDNCIVVVDSRTPYLLHAGNSIEIPIANDSVFQIESTSQILVGLYFSGGACNSDMGDPASVFIPPVEQGVSQVTFVAHNTTLTSTHSTNIITRTDNVDYMLFDNQPIGHNFHPLANGYSYTNLQVTSGIHTLSNNRDRFTAYFYGLGIYESYAYIAGTAMRDLTTELRVDNYRRIGYDNEYYICQYDTLHFYLNSNLHSPHCDWLVNHEMLADTYSSQLNLVFQHSGTDTVEVIVEGFNQPLQAIIHIAPAAYHEILDSVCPHTTYLWGTQPVDTPGYYTRRYPIPDACDSIDALTLRNIYTPTIDLYSYADCHHGYHHLGLHCTDSLPDALWTASPADPTLNGQEHDTAINVSPNIVTTYTLLVTHQCPIAPQIVLNPLQWTNLSIRVSPNILTYDDNIIEAQMLGGNVTHQEWLIDDIPTGNTTPHLRHTVADLTADSIVVALAGSNAECIDTLRRTLPIQRQSLFAPNIFTPNQPTSPTFLLIGEGIADGELMIYNRHGLLIRHIANYTDGWDGTDSHGAPAPQGAYVWTLRYHSILYPVASQTATGTVILMR